MPLVAAKCTQCGGELQIDSAKEAAVCPYCGSAFVVEKAINHYNTTNIINAENVTVTMESELEKQLKAAENCVSSNRKKAYEMFMGITYGYPHDHRAFWWVLRIVTYDFTKYDVLDYYEPFSNSGKMEQFLERYYTPAYDVADENTKAEMASVYGEFMEKARSHAEETHKGKEQRKKELYEQIKRLRKEQAEKYCSDAEYENTIERIRLGVLGVAVAIPVIATYIVLKIVANYFTGGDIDLSDPGNWIFAALSIFIFGTAGTIFYGYKDSICFKAEEFIPSTK